MFWQTFLLIFFQLASQAHFNELCPVSARGSEILCVILAVQSDDTDYVSSMRDFVVRQSFSMNGKRVQFVYLFVNRQRSFVEPFVHKLSQRGVNVDTV